MKRLAAGLLALAMVLTCTGLAFAQENPDPTLQGVTRSQIQANGLPSALVTSGRGVNQNNALQIPRSGFDIINDGTVGTVLLRGVRLFPNPVDCNALQDDAFFLVTVAGRPGDADGDGAFSTNAGLCAAHRNNNPANPKIIDGISVNDLGLLTFGENLRIRLDRNCDGKPDLVFSLTNDPTVATQLRVESDDFTGHAGQLLGGQGVAWQAATYPGTAYPNPCPDPATVTGHYMLRIPNFSSYFAVPGFNPTDFGFIITAGSDDDGLEEDLIAGEVHKPEPRLSITKHPDLSLCPGELGSWTIHVANDGNVKLTNLVVTDVLPAGVTFQQVLSGGVTASGTSTLTFSAFDLAQCESKDIVIQVKANDNCSGDGVNSASVTGLFPSLCGETPGQISNTQVSAGPATANFHCKVKPCVTITLNPLDPQCPDTPVTVTGTAHNCANGPETIFVRIGNGPETNLGVVAMGADVPFSLPAGNLVCGANGADYTVNARATGECTPEGTDSKSVHINCLTAPCVTLTLDPISPKCPGSDINVTGSVHNCGTAAEEVFLSLDGGAEVSIGSVAAGGDKTFSLPAGALQCVDGGHTYTVHARGVGSCPPNANDQKTVRVTCLVGPCVTLTLDPISPKCAGSTINVTGSVHNCSTAAEEVFLSLDGGAEVSIGTVAAGGDKTFSLPAGTLVCVDGGHTYAVHARAVGDCLPNATDDKTVRVTCLVSPCVTLTLDPISPKCPGSTINVTGSVHNCSTAAEEVFLSLDGGAEVSIGSVAAGGDKTFSLPAGTLVCVDGGRTYAVHARAVGDCPPNATDDKTVRVTCLPNACVQLTLDTLGPRCEGADVVVSGSVKNCSTGDETIYVSLDGGAEVNLGTVAGGATKTFAFPAVQLVCVNGLHTYAVHARAVNTCEPAGTDDKTVSVTCQQPQVSITKSGPTSVANLATISYIITVTNPSNSVDLEDVVVTDQLCNYVKNPTNFGGTCNVGAPQVNGTLLTWPAFNLGKGASCTLTFDVTADVTVGGAVCPVTVQCPNLVHVVAYCAGSNHGSKVEADGSWTTQIQCVGTACPRTPGFWMAQCAQRLNGSTKFTAAQVTTIAECIDNTSSFFNWPQGTDFQFFCKNVNTSSPMDQRKQAKRQFVAMLANYCTDQLNLQPSRGGTIFLPGDTPVNCAGLQSHNIADLIAEVDALLADLEGKSLNDPDVKAKYGAIIGCLDAINNGISIPVTSDCAETSGTSSTSEDGGLPIDSGSSSSVQLYRPAPNPFTASTSFAYEVTEGSASVDISIYDVAGREVRKLVSGVQEVGVHTATWDGKNNDGVKVNRGVYFVRTVVAGAKMATNRVIYMTDGR